MELEPRKISICSAVRQATWLAHILAFMLYSPPHQLPPIYSLSLLQLLSQQMFQSTLPCPLLHLSPPHPTKIKINASQVFSSPALQETCAIGKV